VTGQHLVGLLKEFENHRFFPKLASSEDNDFEASAAELTMTNKTFTNGQVNRAGEVLASLTSSPDERTEAIQIVNEWRASFVLPLRAVAKGMGQAALRINQFAIVSRRLKRMESITIKLRRRPTSHIDLTTMQDVGVEPCFGQPAKCISLPRDIRMLDVITT